MLPRVSCAKTVSFAELATKLREFESSLLDQPRCVTEEEMRHWGGLIEILHESVGEDMEWRPFPNPPPPEPDYPTGRAGSKKRKRLRLNYEQQLSEFRKAQAEWSQRYPTQDECSKHNREVESLRTIVRNRRKTFEEIKNNRGWPPVREVPWEILPMDRWPGSQGEVRALIREDPRGGYCPERILHARDLGAVVIWRGLGRDFGEYLAFEYENTDNVLLESPKEGNAAYVLKADWRSLSRLTKQELNRYYSSWIERFVHRHDVDWASAIERAIFR
jgi:hypothetical protein